MIPTVLLLLACTGAPADKPDPTSDGDDTGCALQSWYVDGDGDGYGAGEAVASCSAPADHVASAGDCDDADDSVHPDADEVCNDVDDDCDGVVDPPEQLPTLTCHRDQDGDDWGTTAATLEDCACPDGYAEVVGDCDDEDAAISPDATETWYDGVDQDCAGDDDFDADGDGFSSEDEAEEGLDCDDTDDAVHPDAGEICGNGIDDDCDGLPGACGIVGWVEASDADGHLYHSTSGWDPELQDAVKDQDGDGLAEVLISWSYVAGSREGDCEGVEPIAAADIISLDGGGASDFGDRVISRLWAPVECIEGAGPTGVSAVGGQDIDGDGRVDVVLGVDHYEFGGGVPARVYWASAPFGEEVALEDESYVTVPEDERLLIDVRPHLLESEDGTAASIVMYRTGGVGPGTAARVLAWEHFGGSASWDAAPALSLDAGQWAVAEAAGDVDGDGITDLAARAGDAGSAVDVVVLLGPFEEDRAVDDFDLRVSDEDGRDPTVRSVSICSDSGGGVRLVSRVQDDRSDAAEGLWFWTLDGAASYEVDAPDGAVSDALPMHLRACDGDLDADGQVEWVFARDTEKLVESGEQVLLEVLAPPSTGVWDAAELWLGGVVQDPVTDPVMPGNAIADTDFDGDGFPDLVFKGFDDSLGEERGRLYFLSGGPTGL